MFALYSLAHSMTKTKSPDGEAWIRVLGFFQSKELGVKHALNYYTQEEVRIIPINEFRMLMRQTPTLLNRDAEVKKLDVLMKMHDEIRKEAFEKTAENAKNRVMGELIYSIRDRAELLCEKYKLKFPKETHCVINDTLPSNNEIRMQKFCAIGFIPDYVCLALSEKALDQWEMECKAFFQETNMKDKIELEATETQKLVQSSSMPKICVQGEPALKMLYSANTEEEVKTWIEKNCDLPCNRNYDIACVAMYEWIKVNDVWDEKQKKIYREKSLAKLFDNKEANRLEALKLEGVAGVKEIEILGGAAML